LAREDEMAERPAAEARTRVARTVVLDRTRIASVRGVADHQLALSGEERAVPRVASREHAVEQVIPHGYEAKQIAGRPDAHEIPRAVRRKARDGRRGDARGLRGRLADRQSADRVAVERERGQIRHARGA